MHDLTTKWLKTTCRFAQAHQGPLISYKSMAYEDGNLISGADSRLSFKPEIGMEIRFPGQGLFVSLDRSYVKDYYTGLHDSEAIITVEFNPEDITFGNLTDKETEIAVSKAVLKDVHPLSLEE